MASIDGGYSIEVTNSTRFQWRVATWTFISMFGRTPSQSRAQPSGKRRAGIASHDWLRCRKVMSGCTAALRLNSGSWQRVIGPQRQLMRLVQAYRLLPGCEEHCVCTDSGDRGQQRGSTACPRFGLASP